MDNGAYQRFYAGEPARGNQHAQRDETTTPHGFNAPCSIMELPAAAHWFIQRVTQARQVAMEYEEAYQRLAVALDVVQAELVIAE